MKQQWTNRWNIAWYRPFRTLFSASSRWSWKGKSDDPNDKNLWGLGMHGILCRHLLLSFWRCRWVILHTLFCATIVLVWEICGRCKAGQSQSYGVLKTLSKIASALLHILMHWENQSCAFLKGASRANAFGNCGKLNLTTRCHYTVKLTLQPNHCAWNNSRLLCWARAHAWLEASRHNLSFEWFHPAWFLSVSQSTILFACSWCSSDLAGLVWHSVCISAARQLRVSPLQVKKPQSVTIIAAAHDYHCKYHKGDYLNMISAINKQDYARLHNYNVITPCYLADPTLTSMWNKIGWLLKAMKVGPPF